MKRTSAPVRVALSVGAWILRAAPGGGGGSEWRSRGAGAARYAVGRPRGAVPLVGAGAHDTTAAETLTDAELIERASELIAGGQSARDVATELAAATGRPRRDVYRIIVREHG